MYCACFALDNAAETVLTLVLHLPPKEITIARECEIVYFVLTEKY